MQCDQKINWNFRQMNFLSYPFQAFFQPLELEAFLGKSPAIRKRVAWTHVALAVGWFAIWVTVTYLLAINRINRVEEPWRAIFSFSIVAIILYASTLIISFASGGLSKRDSLVTFVVSTYWSFIISFFAFLLFRVLNQASGQTADLLATAFVPLTIIIVAGIVVNLHGKTRGFRPAALLALAVAISIVLVCQGEQLVVTMRRYQGLKSNQRMVVIEGYYPGFEFSGLFPFTSKKPVSTLLEFNENSPTYVLKTSHSLPPDQSAVFYRLTEQSLVRIKQGRYAQPLDQDIEQLLPDLDRLKDMVGHVYHDDEFRKQLTQLLGTDEFNDFISSEARLVSRGFDGEFYVDEIVPERLALRYKNELEAAENVAGVVLPDNETLLAPTEAEAPYNVERRGSPNWVKPLNSKPLFVNMSYRYYYRYPYRNDLESNVLLKDNLLYLYAEDRPYVLNFADGTDLAEKLDFSWYPSRVGTISPALPTPNGVLSISPSGYLVTQTVRDGKLNVYNQPLYVQELRDFSFGLFLIFAFYLVVTTVVLLFGLYRIPIFIVESIWQTIMMLKIGRQSAVSIRDANKLPLLLDHIATLPLPFSSWFLSRVATTNEAQCGTLLMYLLEKTRQTKLAASQARTFLLQHRQRTIEWFYRLLKPEKKEIFDLLTKQFKKHRDRAVRKRSLKFLPKPREYDNRIEQLFETYEKFISADLKEPLIADVIAALKPFADDGYRYAREVLFTYKVFAKFYNLANVEELADADLALSELHQISVAETLNINLAETWGVVNELANDLKNYDAVESFRDKQYYLSEARIKLYEITRRAQQNVANPEGAVLVEIVENWQELIITEAKLLRGPAELQLVLSNKQLSANGDWNNIQITMKNVGQSPAENIAVSLLENENLKVLENKKQVRLLGTGEVSNLEFTIKPEGNITELRLYFDASFDDFERKSKAFTFADVISLTASVAEFRKIQNPYVVGIPLQSDKVFYGRRKVLNFALENLRAGEQNNVLVFYGQRRIGKSSLLYRIKDSPLKNDYLFVYIDCQGFADADTGKVLYRIADSIHFAAQEQGLRIEKPNIDKFKDNTFIELDAYLDRCEEAMVPRVLVLMLDEYEYLEYKVKDGSLTAEIFNKLRNLMQHRNKRLTFIFVGTHKLQELTSNYWSFLFNTALYYEIGPLGAAEARALTTDPVKGYLRYDDLAVDKILRVTGMHPYFIQSTCRALVNYCNRRRKNYVTLTDVNEVLQEAVENSTAHVKYLYQDYANETEQQILTFLARTTDDSKLSSTAKEISRFALDNGFQFEPGPVQEILSTLKNKRLVREDGELHEQFSFEYEFLRIWIKEHIRIRHSALMTS
jgi:hypothetical protein